MAGPAPGPTATVAAVPWRSPKISVEEGSTDAGPGEVGWKGGFDVFLIYGWMFVDVYYIIYIYIYYMSNHYMYMYVHSCFFLPFRDLDAFPGLKSIC